MKPLINYLISLKRHLFDENDVSPELYRPLIYWSYMLNPFKRTGHLFFPTLMEIENELWKFDVELCNFFLYRSELEIFISENIHEYFHYFSTGYGNTFIGKSAEHFASLKLSNFTGGVFIDIAAGYSPFYKIVKKLFPEAAVYRQDLSYELGIHGDEIGGNAVNLPFSDNSIDFMTLHNSIEHFEGYTDSEFIKECARVLKKDGEVIILPIFLENKHVNYIDPTINPTGLKLDKEAKIVYVYSKTRFMRHYSAETFEEKILSVARDNFRIEIIRIIPSEDFQENIELSLAMRLIKI